MRAAWWGVLLTIGNKGAGVRPKVDAVINEGIFGKAVVDTGGNEVVDVVKRGRFDAGVGSEVCFCGMAAIEVCGRTEGGDWVGTVNCGRKNEVWPGADVCSRDDGGFKAGSKTDVGVGTVIESGTGTVLGCNIDGGLLDTDGETGGTYECRPFRAGGEDGMIFAGTGAGVGTVVEV